MVGGWRAPSELSTHTRCIDRQTDTNVNPKQQQQRIQTQIDKTDRQADTNIYTPPPTTKAPTHTDRQQTYAQNKSSNATHQEVVEGERVGEQGGLLGGGGEAPPGEVLVEGGAGVGDEGGQLEGPHVAGLFLFVWGLGVGGWVDWWGVEHTKLF